jgi:hypothetical protein
MSESGGGHGGGWIVTYSDMVTLLMACFIMVITFASKEPEKYSPLKNSVLYGEGGTNPAGGAKELLDRDALVWRERPPRSRLGQGGSEMPALFADPAMQSTAEVLRSLELPSFGTLGDNYTLRLPLGLLFETDDHLSASGEHLLHMVAENFRRLPFEIRVEVDDPRRLPQGVLLCQQLAEKEGVFPSRLAAGVRASTEPWNPSIWLCFDRRS